MHLSQPRRDATADELVGPRFGKPAVGDGLAIGRPQGVVGAGTAQPERRLPCGATHGHELALPHLPSYTVVAGHRLYPLHGASAGRLESRRTSHRGRPDAGVRKGFSCSSSRVGQVRDRLATGAAQHGLLAGAVKPEDELAGVAAACHQSALPGADADVFDPARLSFQCESIDLM